MRALVFAALLGGASVLLACGGDADDQDNQNDESVTGQPSAESTPIDPPEQLEIPTAPKGTANAEDARIANEVLLRFVGDRTVDAQHFAVIVEDGVLNLIPTEDVDDEEIENAKALVASIDGLKDVRVEGQTPPAQELDADTQEIVEAIDAAHDAAEEDEQDGEDATADDDAPAAVEIDDDAMDVEAVAKLGEPAVQDEESDGADEDAEEPAAEADPSADDAQDNGEMREYTLRRGDSLSIVAARELGNGARWTEIYELNRDTIGPNPERIRDGMVIKLPPRR